MNTPKRVFITVQDGAAFNVEDRSDPGVAVLVLDFDRRPACAICLACIKSDDMWAFSDAHNDFVHAYCLHGRPMTDAEYLNKGGSLCPYCRSPKIEAGDQNFGDVTYEVEVHCNACGRDYFDHYELTGYHS